MVRSLNAILLRTPLSKSALLSRRVDYFTNKANMFDILGKIFSHSILIDY